MYMYNVLLFYIIYTYHVIETNNPADVNHAQIRSLNQPVLSNEGNVSHSTKQQ